MGGAGGAGGAGGVAGLNGSALETSPNGLLDGVTSSPKGSGSGGGGVQFVHPSAVFLEVSHVVEGIMHRPAKMMTKYPSLLRTIGIGARPRPAE